VSAINAQRSCKAEAYLILRSARFGRVSKDAPWSCKATGRGFPVLGQCQRPGEGGDAGADALQALEGLRGGLAPA
jgi:hypothetical protein